MVVKVYISGISGNKEVKKRQQRVLMILDSKNIQYEVVDIAEPGNEEAKEFMQNNAKSLGATIGDANPKHALPPQVFNDEEYCGDYEMFDLANEVDEIEKFLKVDPSKEIATSKAQIKLENGEIPLEKIESFVEKLNDAEEQVQTSNGEKETDETADELTNESKYDEDNKENEKIEENEDLNKSDEKSVKNGNESA